MYATLNLKKITVVSMVIVTLFMSVAATFSYKSSRFGDVNLTYALENLLKQQGWYLLYAMRAGSRNLLASAGSAFGTETTYEQKEARAVPVLLYHGLNSSSEHSITPEAFARQMEALQAAGWQTVTLAEFEAFIKEGKPLPERSFLLTFDDGAKDSYYPVDPVLRVLGYSAVSFILPKYSVGGGTHYYLSSGEIRTMLESGRWEIGSHGQDSHEFVAINENGDQGAKLANLAWLPEEGRRETNEEFKARVSADLASSRKNLEAEFGRPITNFAFPFGEFGQLSRDHELALAHNIETIARSIYNLVFYQTWEGEGFSFNYPHNDRSSIFMIKRIEPTAATTPEDLVKKLEDGLPKNLPYYDDFSTDRGWFSTWGAVDFKAANLYLDAGENETGVAAVLDGSGHWENYRSRFTLKSESGSGFVVFVRFIDEQNFAGCNFGNRFLHAEETVAGQRRVINGIRSGGIAIPTNTEFTIDATVSGRTLTCTLNGNQSVTTDFLDESLSEGGIGVKVWNEEPGSGELTVIEMSADSIEHEEPEI